jgi:hypothetical protein
MYDGVMMMVMMVVVVVKGLGWGVGKMTMMMYDD